MSGTPSAMNTGVKSRSGACRRVIFKHLVSVWPGSAVVVDRGRPRPQGIPGVSLPTALNDSRDVDAPPLRRAAGGRSRFLIRDVGLTVPAYEQRDPRVRWKPRPGTARRRRRLGIPEVLGGLALA